MPFLVIVCDCAGDDRHRIGNQLGDKLVERISKASFLHMKSSLTRPSQSVHHTTSSQIMNHINFTPPTVAFLYLSAPNSSGIKSINARGTMYVK